jgi:hypothetical protein
MCAAEQGDQIGRIFACWAIVFMGSFFVNYESRQKFCAMYLHTLFL